MDYLSDEDRATRIQKDFEHHIATLSSSQDHIGEITTVEWRRPKDGNYRIVYMLRGGLLLVYGDMGDAVYQWSSRIDLKFLAECDLEYFSGKCQASETGRGGEDWDCELARKSFLEVLTNSYEIPLIKAAAYINKHRIEFGRHEYLMFLSDAPGIEGREFDTCEMGNIGERASWRTHSHLVGLKMAYAQLNPKPEMPPEAIAEVTPRA
jgi:hypothetical protein